MLRQGRSINFSELLPAKDDYFSFSAEGEVFLALAVLLSAQRALLLFCLDTNY